VPRKKNKRFTRPAFTDAQYGRRVKPKTYHVNGRFYTWNPSSKRYVRISKPSRTRLVFNKNTSKYEYFSTGKKGDSFNPYYRQIKEYKTGLKKYDTRDYSMRYWEWNNFRKGYAQYTRVWLEDLKAYIYVINPDTTRDVIINKIDSKIPTIERKSDFVWIKFGWRYEDETGIEIDDYTTIRTSWKTLSQDILEYMQTKDADFMAKYGYIAIKLVTIEVMMLVR